MVNKILIGTIVIAGIILLALFATQQTTTGQFTLASFELDDYGEYWFSPNPLSFGQDSNGQWIDQQNKFVIGGIGKDDCKPFVDDRTSALTIPRCPQSSAGEGSAANVFLNTHLKGKDYKWIFSFREGVGQLQADVPTFDVALINKKDAFGNEEQLRAVSKECHTQQTIQSGAFYSIEWRTSKILPEQGALFVNGIKICEVQDVGDKSIVLRRRQWRTIQGDRNVLTSTDTFIWAVGQRLPFNCRIDTSHEAFFLDRPFPSGTKINLDSFAFTPIAFCEDSPVIFVSSRAEQESSLGEGGIDSSTEPFLRWAENKELIVPNNQVWLVTYVADWKRAGLQSGCAMNDRYLVSESNCETDARIVVAKQTEQGIVADQITQTGVSITQVIDPREHVTLEETNKKLSGGAFRNPIFIIIFLILFLTILFFIIYLVVKNK